MRYILRWISAMVLASGPLAANLTGYVEYHLPPPQTGKEWRVGKQGTEKEAHGTYTTTVWVPDSTGQNQTAAEYFGASVNNVPSGPQDPAALKALLEQQFPGQKIQVQVLDSVPEAVLYEWSSSRDNQETAHGWTRIFSTKEGTVTLGYLTQQPSVPDRVRRLWIKALSEAKIVKPVAVHTMGYVEYQLPAPNTGTGWRVAKESDRDILYVPDSTTSDDASLEYFGATSLTSPGKPHDKASLKALLERQFPGQAVQVRVLDTSFESALYEWSVSNGQQETIHGWTRIFSTNKGIVSLEYLTQDPRSLRETRTAWIDAFKAARIKE